MVGFRSTLLLLLFGVRMHLPKSKSPAETTARITLSLVSFPNVFLFQCHRCVFFRNHVKSFINLFTNLFSVVSRRIIVNDAERGVCLLRRRARHIEFAAFRSTPLSEESGLVGVNKPLNQIFRSFMTMYFTYVLSQVVKPSPGFASYGTIF